MHGKDDCVGRWRAGERTYNAQGKSGSMAVVMVNVCIVSKMERLVVACAWSGLVDDDKGSGRQKVVRFC